MKRLLVIITVVGILMVAALSWQGTEPAFHTQEELNSFQAMSDSLPNASNQWFATSGLCVECHSTDTAGLASVNAAGKDVNVVNDWRATMMANSAKDPLWRAKVSHEVLVNPGLQQELEHKCTSCHAPLGHYSALLEGQQYYGMTQLQSDTFGLDGVSCGACHQMAWDSVGQLFSGAIIFDTTRKVYGPYIGPFIGPMQDDIGFPVSYGPHIANAGLCASCHTLITQTVDTSGNLTGDEFVEQATYHEWVNSDYFTLDSTCQECHLPQIPEGVILSYENIGVGTRSPYGLHHMVGGNTFMLQLMQQHIAELDLKATSLHFDSVIVRTNRQLKERTLDLLLSEANRTADTVFYDVELINKAGHKFPSGYPARRAFVELAVMDSIGDTLFHSGGWDSNYNLPDHDLNWEVHYDVIDQPTQVQIYEMVMGDVNGNKTTVLERAYIPLKDNRIPPVGFSTQHNSYDTTLIAGGAQNDTDFNWNGPTEGSGADIVHYHVPLGGYSGFLNVSAKVWYQSVPPRWLIEMFSYSSPEIDSFRTMYQQADGTPVLINSTSLGDLFPYVEEHEIAEITVFPNPTTDGWVYVKYGQGIEKVELFDMSGKLIKKLSLHKQSKARIRLPQRTGTYLLRVYYEKGVVNRILIRR